MPRVVDWWLLSVARYASCAHCNTCGVLILTSFLAIPTVPVGASHMTRKMSSGDAWLQTKIPLVSRCSAPCTVIGFPKIHSCKAKPTS